MSAPIFIIGLPGTGKTTQGREIARCLGYTFYDLDFCIEQRFHATISEIFQKKGEAEFRRIERMMLRELGEFDNVVISCGGGTPCYHDNMEFMNGRGLTVRLKTSVEELTNRISRNPGKRPLFSDIHGDDLLNSIKIMAAEREHFYAQARIHLEVKNKRRLHNDSKEIEHIRQLIREVKAQSL